MIVIKEPWQFVKALGRRIPGDGIGDGIAGLAGMWHGLDWGQVCGDVDRECRLRILVAGHPNAGKSTLVNWLKDFPVSPVKASGCGGEHGWWQAGTDDGGEADGLNTGAGVEDYGLFCIVDVPTHERAYSRSMISPGVQTATGNELNGQAAQAFWDAVQESALILWVINGQTGLQAHEHEWIGQLRNTGKPLLLVINKQDAVASCTGLAAFMAELSRRFGGNSVAIGARDGAQVISQLLPGMISANPELATSLGREIPKWRLVCAKQMVQRAALMSGVLGLEPTPLIDLPLQIMIQLRMMLRIMATFGRPTADRYGREMLMTVTVGMLMRFFGMQLVRLVPIAGWLLAGLLAGVGTYSLGIGFIHYFECRVKG